MNEQRQNTSRLDLIRRLALIFKQQTKLANKLGKCEELAQNIEFDLAELLEELALKPDALVVAVGSPRVKRGIGNVAPLGSPNSRAASSLEIAEQDDGSFRVRIDGRPEFKLSPLLGALLSILAAENGFQPGEKVSWKILSEIPGLLESKTSKKFSEHAVSQLVSRLRKELFANGENPGLVQTNRRLGAVRFAFQRKAPNPVPINDESRGRDT